MKKGKVKLLSAAIMLSGLLAVSPAIADDETFPIEIIDKYGTDALRFSLILGISAGNDIRYMPEKLEAAANFANKLWNASKFVLSNLAKEEHFDASIRPEKLMVEDKWILSKLNKYD